MSVDETGPDRNRRQLIIWLWRLPVIGVVAGGAYGLHYGWRIHFGKAPPDEAPAFEPRDPVFVARTGDLPDIWDARPFELGETPAIAMRLPEPISGGITVAGKHYAAFSRICTHLGCTVNFTRDTEAIAVAFNYRSPAPALTCPCHLSVFRVDQAGQAASGPAVDPIPRVALEARGDELYAVGIEQAREA